jgi:predicted nuclease of predicted toxin-antitoxin system
VKLLLDQGLPRSAAGLLRATGIDTVHVGEIGYATAEDSASLQLGVARQRVIVTLDADFHALLARSGEAMPSVIRIRIEGLRAELLVNLLESVLAACEPDLEAGAVVTVQQNRLRIRRLPL